MAPSTLGSYSPVVESRYSWIPRSQSTSSAFLLQESMVVSHLERIILGRADAHGSSWGFPGLSVAALGLPGASWGILGFPRRSLEAPWSERGGQGYGGDMR